MTIKTVAIGILDAFHESANTIYRLGSRAVICCKGSKRTDTDTTEEEDDFKLPLREINPFKIEPKNLEQYVNKLSYCLALHCLIEQYKFFPSEECVDIYWELIITKRPIKYNHNTSTHNSNYVCHSSWQPIAKTELPFLMETLLRAYQVICCSPKNEHFEYFDFYENRKTNILRACVIHSTIQTIALCLACAYDNNCLEVFSQNTFANALHVCLREISEGPLNGLPRPIISPGINEDSFGN